MISTHWLQQPLSPGELQSGLQSGHCIRWRLSCDSKRIKRATKIYRIFFKQLYTQLRKPTIRTDIGRDAARITEKKKRMTTSPLLMCPSSQRHHTELRSSPPNFSKETSSLDSRLPNFAPLLFTVPLSKILPYPELFYRLLLLLLFFPAEIEHQQGSPARKYKHSNTG